MTWQQRYQQAHEQYFKRIYPAAYRDMHYAPPPYPKVSTANGLTKMVVNHLLWSSHHGERTNNMGVPVQKTAPRYSIFSETVVQIANGIDWRKGGGMDGTTDVKGHIQNPNYKFPIPIYVEVKVRKDFMKHAQEKYKHQVTSTGALHLVCKTPDDWFNFYDYIINL